METITVTVSNRGYIVLPSSLRKAMEIKPGAKMMIRRDNDKLILTSVSSFTDKLAGITKGTIAQTADDVEHYIEKEREDR